MWKEPRSTETQWVTKVQGPNVLLAPGPTVCLPVLQALSPTECKLLSFPPEINAIKCPVFLLHVRNFIPHPWLCFFSKLKIYTVSYRDRPQIAKAVSLEGNLQQVFGGDQRVPQPVTGTVTFTGPCCTWLF